MRWYHKCLKSLAMRTVTQVSRKESLQNVHTYNNKQNVRSCLVSSEKGFEKNLLHFFLRIVDTMCGCN